jgi:glycosyltransferase involved in cell wall biosynthesis
MQPHVVSANGLISVVVPVYNGVKTLPECLAGLQKQTLAPEHYEVTVVDDGSTDGSADAAAQSGVRVIRQAHRGAAAARNAGIAAAHGEVVLFTDADCSPAPDWIEQMASSMADPAIAGAKGAYRTRQRGFIPRFVQMEYRDRYDRMAGQEEIDFVDTYAAAYRRNLLVESGGFDETFPGAAVEDVDLSYRLASQGHRMVFNPRAIVCHRHPATLLRYLSRKASYGYWRVPIYARYPAKTGGDSHTPPVLKWQLGLAAAALALAPAVPLSPGASWIWLGVMVAFLVSTTPFCIKALRRDAPIAVLCPVMLWLRAVAIGLGLAWGLVHQARSRRPAGRPSVRRPDSVTKG